ncbi:hypothetical protein FRB99_005125 [Tulasnella sp. 403]|nr:hypothetical protein FRB99_005125 [Tulasnella sp. 403]
MASSPPTRRLSQRRGSMAAPDPFLQHEAPSSVSGSSRITIVRVPTVKDNTPPSPGTQPRDSFSRGSDRDPSSLARRSSWGSAKSVGSDGGSGGGLARGRMSFAFATFTPINPPPGQTPLPDRSGAITPTSSGPPSPASFRSKGRSFSGGQVQAPIPRANPLSPEQLYEVAQQATNPNKTNPPQKYYGYGGQAIPAPQVQQGSVQAAPFVPLPSEVYLPFINRPQEVTQLLATPQTGRLFALLASTFPQDTGAAASISRPPSAMSVRQHATGGSTTSLQQAFSDLPEDPRTWTFMQLSFWLRHVTRQEANDREWIHKIRTCINSRSEVLWQRLAAALGVPPGFDEEGEESAVADEDDFDVEEGRVSGVGKTGVAGHGLPGGRTSQSGSDKPEQPSSLPDTDSPASAAAQVDLDAEEWEEEFDPSSLPGSEAIIEPITASSLPPLPGAFGLTDPSHGLGLTPGDTHTLGDVREEDEEPEPEPKQETPEAPLSSSYSSRLGLQAKDYSPRAHSPLAASTTAAEGESSTSVRRPSLTLATSTTPATPPTTTIQAPSAAEEPAENEIDFTEPDPNAEPIQGIRIMNAPMMLYPGPRLTEGEIMASPGVFTPPHAESGGGALPHGPGAPHGPAQAVGHPELSGRPSGLLPAFHQRVGSFGSGHRVGGAHQRTQSFGAFGLHGRSRSTASISSLQHGSPLALQSGMASPMSSHFPGSFAGLGAGAPP